MPQMIFRTKSQSVLQQRVIQSFRFVLNLHDFPDYENIFSLRNAQVLHIVKRAFLLLLHLMDHLVMCLSIHTRRLSHDVRICSSIFTSVSSSYFVMNTPTPYLLFICTLSINILINNKPNPAARISAICDSFSVSVTGRTGSFTST